jgi:hypothetical protein
VGLKHAHHEREREAQRYCFPNEQVLHALGDVTRIDGRAPVSVVAVVVVGTGNHYEGGNHLTYSVA